MSKKIIMSLLIVTVLLGFPIAYEIFAARWSSQNSLSRIAERIKTEKNLTVSIGSSRLIAGLNPQAFANQLVTLGIPFMDLRMQKLIVEEFSPALKNHSKVILEYSPEMLFLKTLERQPEMTDSLATLGISPWKWRFILIDPKNWQVGTFFPALTKLRMIPRQLTGEGTHSHFVSETGFVARPRRGTEESLKNEAEHFQQKIAAVYKKDAVKKGLKIFAEFQQWLELSGLNYCWLSMPTHPVYKKLQKNDYAEIENSTKDILAHYSCLKTEEIEQLSQQLPFADPNHLSDEGAFYFSKVLAGRVKN